LSPGSRPRERIVARTEEDRESFLRKSGFSKSETSKIIEAVLGEENRRAVVAAGRDCRSGTAPVALSLNASFVNFGLSLGALLGSFTLAKVSAADLGFVGAAMRIGRCHSGAGVASVAPDDRLPRLGRNRVSPAYPDGNLSHPRRWTAEPNCY
jgi:hypothetical protein